jgi:hypothetical protein
MPKKLTTGDFITKSHQIHNNKYDYSSVVYSNSKTKVNIICNDHGLFEQNPGDHLNGSGCKKCADLSRRSIMIERYGVEYAGQSKELIKKRTHTNLDRYGTEHAAQSLIVQDKMKQSNLDRYGVEYPIMLEEFKEKRNQNNIEKYGVDNVSKLPEIKEKKKQQYLERYGVKHPHQQSISHILPLIEDYDWLFDQYINQNKTSEQIANELNIGSTTVLRYLHNHEISIKYTVGFSYRCIAWLEQIIRNENINIQHALNGGEYQIPGTRYKADGYCRETNTIYEFHGDIFHGNPEIFNSDEKCHQWSELTAGELYQKTIKRDQEIRDLGYTLITIWENDYMRGIK